jgi:hypothetical protein
LLHTNYCLNFFFPEHLGSMFSAFPSLKGRRHFAFSDPVTFLLHFKISASAWFSISFFLVHPSCNLLHFGSISFHNKTQTIYFNLYSKISCLSILLYISAIVGSEVFTAVTMKNAVFLVVAPCRCCMNRNGGTSVHTGSTRRHIPEDCILHFCNYFT